MYIWRLFCVCLISDCERRCKRGLMVYSWKGFDNNNNDRESHWELNESFHWLNARVKPLVSYSLMLSNSLSSSSLSSSFDHRHPKWCSRDQRSFINDKQRDLSSKGTMLRGMFVMPSRDPLVNLMWLVDKFYESAIREQHWGQHMTRWGNNHDHLYCWITKKKMRNR